MGARSALRLGLTDEQPVLCAEPRGPGSLSREEEEAQDGTVGKGLQPKTGGGGRCGGGDGGGRSGSYGFLVLKWWQPSRLKVMCQVSVGCFGHSRWTLVCLCFISYCPVLLCSHFTICVPLLYDSFLCNKFEKTLVVPWLLI